MPSYKEHQWKTFRASVIELDGYICAQCHRGNDEVVLQVHHKIYRPGLKIWEYALSDCITLCRGCHAMTHGIIQPNFGWEYISDDDHGDLSAVCENAGCGTPIRYVFTIMHELWGILEVGTVCCDNLTDSVIASNLKESRLKFEGRKQRFIRSKKWVIENSSHKIRIGLFDVEILEHQSKYSLIINGKKSKIKHDNLQAAKTVVFENIENGELMKYFISIQFDFNNKNKGKHSSR